MRRPLSAAWLFAAIGLLALAAGAGLWWGTRPAGNFPVVTRPSIAPAALMATTFTDEGGQRRALAQFQGKVVLLNFWATWCAPCREEMPAFERLQKRWAEAGVQFVGVSAEDPLVVKRFGRGLGVGYPLWTGGDEVRELSRRLGNAQSVLPHSVLIGPGGEVLESKVGAYKEAELDALLARYARKSS